MIAAHIREMSVRLSTRIWKRTYTLAVRNVSILDSCEPDQKEESLDVSSEPHYTAPTV